MHTLKFLALGDSYTIGECVPASERWPVQLVNHLRGKGIAISNPHIVAQTGWTTDELLAALAKAGLQPEYNLVSLLIGVNNQYRGYNQEIYRREFRSLLQKAIQFAKRDPSRVIVLSIPDWGVTPFAQGQNRGKIAAEIDAFNRINRKITREAQARYVDITPISKLADHAPSLIAADGLHPSGEMYTLWVDAVLSVMNEF
jgi:lysophospholipase L1-like esterase